MTGNRSGLKEEATELFAKSTTKHLTTFQLICTLAFLVAFCLSFQPAWAQNSVALCASEYSAASYIKAGVYVLLIVVVLSSTVAAALGRMKWGALRWVLIGCVAIGLAAEVTDGLCGSKN